MNPPQPPRDEALWDWLQIATKGLSPRAASRITAEIEAHYDEAVTAHLTEGTSPVGAQTLAIEELGDAKKAARNFRKKHLTEREIKRLLELKDFARKGPSFFSGAGSVLIASFFVFFLFDNSGKKTYFNDLIFLFIISNSLFDWIGVLLIQVWLKKITTQSIILMQFIHSTITWAIVILSINWSRQHVMISIGIYFILFAHSAFHYVRTQGKLRNDPLPEQ